MQPESALVVFREAFGVENQSASQRGQAVQRLTGKARPYPVRRQKSAQALPHRDVLGLVLGEFIAVYAVRERARAGCERQNGNLDYAIIARVPVDQPKRFRMDQI